MVVDRYRDELLWNLDRVLRNQQRQTAEEGEAVQVADARPRGRFDGADPEPRAGLPSGHMPGSRSLPFTELLQEDGVSQSAHANAPICLPVAMSCCSHIHNHGRRGMVAHAQRMKAPAALDLAFRAAGLDARRPLAATCGSGVTACVIALAAHVVQQQQMRGQDGGERDECARGAAQLTMVGESSARAVPSAAATAANPSHSHSPVLTR